MAKYIDAEELKKHIRWRFMNAWSKSKIGLTECYEIDSVIDEEKEIKVLENYLPEQLSDDEVNSIIDDIFSKVQPKGMQEMGKIMGMISPLVKGKADLGSVSSKIREKLSSL